jgi:RHS repeat-associated protein
VQDAATGLTYMQQRYYDPLIGRFLSVDPVTAYSMLGANFNRYWYANNNPYKFTDPDGRFGTPWEDLVDGFKQASVDMHLNGSVDGASGGSAWTQVGYYATVGMVQSGQRHAGGPRMPRMSMMKPTGQVGRPSSGKAYHYTDAKGAQAIKESGVIKPDAKGRVYLTTDKVKAGDANNELFMGQGGTKGTHVVEVDVRKGVDLQPGTQPNELVHKGAVRDGRQADLKVKENDF